MPTPNPPPARDDRPSVALITNTLPPYRVHLYRRLVVDIPEVRFLTFVTHEIEAGRWVYDPPTDINATLFGPGERPNQATELSHALAEWRKGGRIIRALREQNIQAVVMQGHNDPARGRIIFWCHRRGIPCFVRGDSNIRDEQIPGWKARLKLALLPRLLARCAGAMPVGSLGKAYYQKYGVPDDRIFIVPFDPGYELIESITESQIADVKQRFGLAEGRRRLAFSGRLLGMKRVDQLIDAFAAIATSRPHWDLVIIGDGVLRQSLMARVPEDLHTRVIWTGFIDDQRDLCAIYRACDVLVLPSNQEKWGVVVNEAAASGMALVTSDIVGAGADLVQDGVNGYVFPAENLDALVDALRNVTDPARIDAFRAASRQVIHAWRTDMDPAAGCRNALQAVGVLPHHPGSTMPRRLALTTMVNQEKSSRG